MWNWILEIMTQRRSHRAALEADVRAWMDRSEFDARRARSGTAARR